SCRSGRPPETLGLMARRGVASALGDLRIGSDVGLPVVAEPVHRSLSRLSILDLRSIASLEAGFGSGPQLVVGPNAAGKTTLLEAIVLLAWGRSHRTTADAELVRWGSELARVEGVAGRETIEVGLVRPSAAASARKRIRVNGVGRRAAGLSGLLRTVVFAPGEMPRDALARRLVETAEKEIWNGSTVIGPHRDDVVFTLDGRDMSSFASRGQQRTAILAFKLAELDLHTAQDGRPPLLLLDDVFSELDPARRAHLVRRIAELPQSFVTTTTVDDLDPALVEAATGWQVGPDHGAGASLRPFGGR